MINETVKHAAEPRWEGPATSATQDLTSMLSLAGPLRGPLLVLTSAIAFSTAGFFSRHLPTNLWALVFWRNIFGCLALLPVLGGRRGRADMRATLRDRRARPIVACSAFGTICYLGAFAHTSVANVSIIYAAAPLLTAMLAWLTIHEAVAARTLAAAALALLGVAITMSSGIGGATALGDTLALLMTLALALMTVLARSRPSAPLPTAFVAALLAAGLVLPLGLAAGQSFAVSGVEALWLAGFGLVSMSVALPCYLAGAAAMPASRAMLISAIELPFAPLWVWLAFGEEPSRAAIMGGSLVTLAILGELAAPELLQFAKRKCRTSPSATV